MPKFSFVCEHENFRGESESKITVEFEKESLFEVIEEFERFLKGSGFVFEGQLDIVSKDAETIKSQVDNYYDDMSLFRPNYYDPIVIGNLDGNLDIISLDNIGVGNLDYIVNLSLGNDDIPINFNEPASSTSWPFPLNERPV